MKGPWDIPDDASTDRAYEEFRRYRQLNRRYHRGVRRQRLRQRFMRRFGWPGLAAIAACAVVWALMTFSPWQALPSLTGWRGGAPSTSVVSRGPFRNCAEARAAGAAPIYWGQSGYASRLDRDGDGIACEPWFGRR